MSSISNNSLHPPSLQRGATLLVAVIMLMIITMLGIASMRGITLESRITANLKQEKLLFNAAEAGLRLGEASIDSAFFNVVPDVGLPCSTAVPVHCLPYDKNFLGGYSDTTTFFSSSNVSKVVKVNATASTTTFASNIEWYTADLGCLGGLSQDGGAATGNCGTRYYEVDSCASLSGTYCTDDTTSPRVIVRSVFAKPYN